MKLENIGERLKNKVQFQGHKAALLINTVQQFSHVNFFNTVFNLIVARFIIIIGKMLKSFTP